jgi:quinol monooxygenase YgiN
MIIVSGSMRINPDARQLAIDAGSEMMAATRSEPGNRVYSFAFSFDDPALVRVYEEWDDQAALDAHMSSAHMATFAGKFGTFIAEGGDGLQLHEVASSKKFM